jgi:hypothetical protein
MATATPPAAKPQQKDGRKRGRLASGLTWFTSILASLATIAAAVASLFAAHQTDRVNQLTVVVRQQQQQLRQVSKPGTSPGAAPSSKSSGGALPAGGVYLSAMQPTVDNADEFTGSQTMSASQYPSSVGFYCAGPQSGGQPDEAFNVAGHKLFTAVVGIPDSAEDSTNLDETVIFANQAGVQLIKPVIVSLGHPARVQLSIAAVTQLEVTCSGTNTANQQQDNGHLLVLGNGAVS